MITSDDELDVIFESNLTHHYRDVIAILSWNKKLIIVKLVFCQVMWVYYDSFTLLLTLIYHHSRNWNRFYLQSIVEKKRRKKAVIKEQTIICKIEIKTCLNTPEKGNSPIRLWKPHSVDKNLVQP